MGISPRRVSQTQVEVIGDGWRHDMGILRDWQPIEAEMPAARSNKIEARGRSRQGLAFPAAMRKRQKPLVQRIRGVDHLAHGGGKRKERDDVLPSQILPTAQELRSLESGAREQPRWSFRAPAYTPVSPI
jgi:hypothetical protein